MVYVHHHHHRNIKNPHSDHYLIYILFLLNKRYVRADRKTLHNSWPVVIHNFLTIDMASSKRRSGELDIVVPFDQEEFANTDHEASTPSSPQARLGQQGLASLFHLQEIARRKKKKPKVLHYTQQYDHKYQNPQERTVAPAPILSSAPGSPCDEGDPLMPPQRQDSSKQTKEHLQTFDSNHKTCSESPLYKHETAPTTTSGNYNSTVSSSSATTGDSAKVAAVAMSSLFTAPSTVLGSDLYATQHTFHLACFKMN